MKALLQSRAAAFACLLALVFPSLSTAQGVGNCADIANDVTAAVSKDPSKVLMVVEDALVINEGCASDIVKAAILSSKADAVLANQIVQTAVSVAPKMAGVINDAASSVVPGLAAVAPAAELPERPVTIAEKNPGKNPVVPASPPVREPDFFIPASIRGVFLIQPPASGPLPVSPCYAYP